MHSALVILLQSTIEVIKCNVEFLIQAAESRSFFFFDGFDFFFYT